MHRKMEEITGDAVEIHADSDSRVATNDPEMSGNVRMLMLTAQAQPHCNTSLQQRVLPQT